MGILNVTPDSFSDGGRHAAADAALVHARSMIAEGADIIDIGAESTRPGAAAVDASEEWARLEPVLAPVIALGVPVSIDTYKADIARRACALGSAIVNDVWGLQKDPGMADVVAAAGVCTGCASDFGGATAPSCSAAAPICLKVGNSAVVPKRAWASAIAQMPSTVG